MNLVLWLILGVFASAGLSLLGVQTSWRSKVSTQFEIDSCTTQTADTLAKTMNSLQESAARHFYYRQALMVLEKSPAVLIAQNLRLLIAGEYSYQILLSGRWTFIQARWNTYSLCNSKSISLPIPNHGFQWDIPDQYGPKPPKRKTNAPKYYELKILKNNRLSIATIETKSSGSAWSSQLPIFKKAWFAHYGSHLRDDKNAEKIQ